MKYFRFTLCGCQGTKISKSKITRDHLATKSFGGAKIIRKHMQGLKPVLNLTGYHSVA